MLKSVVQGIELSEERPDTRVIPALQAGTDELLWAHGLIIGTPEHFGYMSGAVKDFMDRTFYPVEGKVDGLPYAMFVSAGNDGTGAVSAVDRIASGYKWKRVAEPVIARGELTPLDHERCRELGQTLAAGLALGIF
jgi:NAD(P)H-dependent FMN reductase